MAKSLPRRYHHLRPQARPRGSPLEWEAPLPLFFFAIFDISFAIPFLGVGLGCLGACKNFSVPLGVSKKFWGLPRCMQKFFCAPRCVKTFLGVA